LAASHLTVAPTSHSFIHSFIHSMSANRVVGHNSIYSTATTTTITAVDLYQPTACQDSKATAKPMCPDEMKNEVRV
ncbi:unnamed protein product, partial [Ceratitis capitata]